MYKFHSELCPLFYVLICSMAMYVHTLQDNNGAAGNLGLSFKEKDLDKRGKRSNNVRQSSPRLEQTIEVIYTVKILVIPTEHSVY